MKIAQETPTLLVLKQSNVIGILFGILFTVAGIVMFFVNHGPHSLIFNGIILGAGLLSLLPAKFVTITVDKTQGKFTCVTKRIIGKKVQEIPLAQIKQVALEEFMMQNSPVNNNNQGMQTAYTRNYRLVFYMQDGQGISFILPTNTMAVNGIPIGGFMRGKNKHVVFGQKIASFLGVPFVDKEAPSLASVARDIVQTVSQGHPMNEVPPK